MGMGVDRHRELPRCQGDTRRPASISRQMRGRASGDMSHGSTLS
jgi:hypothetical protein